MRTGRRHALEKSVAFVAPETLRGSPVRWRVEEKSQTARSPLQRQHDRNGLHRSGRKASAVQVPILEDKEKSKRLRPPIRGFELPVGRRSTSTPPTTLVTG